MRRSPAYSRLQTQEDGSGVRADTQRTKASIGYVLFLFHALVRAVAWTLHDAAQKAKGRLCGKRAGSPAALA